MVATASPSAERQEVRLQLVLRGGNREAWEARELEILVQGPRGTGKTRTILELLNALCQNFPGLVVAIVRKYQKTLAGSCLRTLNEQVLHEGDGVQFFGGNENEPASYRYRNGSRMVAVGMDNPEKVKSSEYDLIYPNEVTELTEEEYESLLPLRRHRHNGRRLIEHQRIISDCNPANSAHWMNQRCERGETRRIVTTLKDNPAYYDDAGNILPDGQAYLDGLKGLTGPRRDRWVLGLWTGTENACYPTFDRDQQIRPLEPGLQLTTIIGEDYGAQHLCAVAALSIDQFNRRWVREVWAGSDDRPDPTKPSSIDLIVSQFKEKYKAKRGRVDPNQAKLASDHGFNVARGGNGGATGAPRLHRIDLMERLFYVYEGGRVPTSEQVTQLAIPRGPFMEPDSYGIYLVEGMPGIEDLANEIEAYHYVFFDTPKGKSKDVYRVDDDRIASVEYANEEYEEGETERDVAGPARISLPSNSEKRTYGGLIRKAPPRSYGSLGGRRG